MDSNFYPGGENQPNMPIKKEKSSLGLILGLIALLIIVLLIAVFYPKSSEAPTVDDSENGIEASQEVVRSFATIDPDDWHMKSQAEEDLAVLAPNQVITDYIAQSPADTDIVYFATNAYSEDDETNLISIYEYNNSDYSFERIFRMAYDSTVSPAGMDAELIPQAHVLGYDQGKLVILFNEYGMDRLPCEQYILSADDAPITGGAPARDVVMMDLENPYSGFPAYELSDEIRERAEEAVRECAENM